MVRQNNEPYAYAGDYAIFAKARVGHLHGWQASCKNCDRNHLCIRRPKGPEYDCHFVIFDHRKRRMPGFEALPAE